MPTRRRRRRRERKRRALNRFFWSDTKERIEEGKITPFIGDSINSDFIFGEEEYKAIIEDWAYEIGYPGQASHNLTRVAQFFRIIEDPSAARSSYLNFLKDILLEIAENEDISTRQLKKVEANIDQLSFSEMAEDLGYLNFADQPEEPLSMLAALPLPIYVTTGYHRFLETALRQAGKEPRSEIYYWRPDLVNAVPSIFAEDPAFRPSDSEPLVYHLYGRDDYPDSLVLTENDYLDFLVQVSQDMSRNRMAGDSQGLPPLVEAALAQSSLLMLGYELEAWDFRTLFRGLIKARNEVRLKEGVSIQVDKSQNLTEAAIKKRVEKYFLQTSQLLIYWGDPQSCLAELQEIWRE